jgi:hypothetical protein
VRLLIYYWLTAMRQRVRGTAFELPV